LPAAPQHSAIFAARTPGGQEFHPLKPELQGFARLRLFLLADLPQRAGFVPLVGI